MQKYGEAAGTESRMDDIERRIVQLIDENRSVILDFANDIYNHAELGTRKRVPQGNLRIS